MFESFFRLSDALRSITSPQSSVFSWEIGLKGKRKFLLAPIDEFWVKYQTWPDKKYYEVIKSDYPSKLYFDLEFSVKHNPKKDGSEMCKMLLKLTSELLKDHLNHVAITKDILVLEASTAVKFSLHVIYTKTIFKNNQMVGQFVKIVKNKLNEKFPGQFEVMKGDRVDHFVDSSVYRRNQNLRLFLSRKFGKMNPLQLSSSLSSSDWKCDCLEKKKKVFMGSLVSNVDTSIIPLTLSIEDNNQNIRQPSVVSVPVKKVYGTIYSEIEEMVNNIVKPGFIRDSIIYPGFSSIIVFLIGGSKYCRNVRREHTSNNVYFICNLDDLTLVQACHSCKHFRSTPIPIPADKISWLDTDIDELENWN